MTTASGTEVQADAAAVWVETAIPATAVLDGLMLPTVPCHHIRKHLVLVMSTASGKNAPTTMAITDGTLRSHRLNNNNNNNNNNCSPAEPPEKPSESQREHLQTRTHPYCWHRHHRRSFLLQSRTAVETP